MTTFGIFLIHTDSDKRAWVRAEDISAIYEDEVSIARRGRPPTEGHKPTPVIALTMRNGKVLYGRDETLDTILNKIAQALGIGKIHQVPNAVYEKGQEPQAA